MRSAVALLCSLLLLCLGGCFHRAGYSSPAGPNAAPPPVTFIDVTPSAGIRFHHVTGAYGRKLFPETMGSGCAFLDYDDDGWLDILLLNGNYWPGHAPPGAAPTMALYRNNHDGTFTNVTRQAGLSIPLYEMGVAVGDYDNDGYDDLFITALGGSHLFHNVPDGHGGRRFQDVTA
ncbi:MAG TPA: FG-GAP-like repeat-containing protein, partial [Chthonomonadales bacterium]|nr:FG-GAP-like repeat-containing protein [Chthonomonadales bacterium]